MDDAVKVIWVEFLHFFFLVARDDFRKHIVRDELNLAFDVLETVDETIAVDEDNPNKEVHG